MTDEQRELINAHLSLGEVAGQLAEEWLKHRTHGRTEYVNQINVMLADNDRERKKIERKLRKKHGIRL
jgi:hypothetical protein